MARQKNTNLTIANTIENCIKKLRPLCELKSNFFISSRTDAGVHAIENTGHFDLEINQVDTKLKSDQLLERFRSQLNDVFIQENHAIR